MSTTTVNLPIGPLVSDRISSLFAILFDREQALKQFFRVAVPGVIQAWDEGTQTATVQIAITEQIRIAKLVQSGQGQYTISQLTNQTIDPLQNVPICVPRGGGFSITVPVQKGDECLLIFGDQCIDSWWTSGCPENELGTGYLSVQPPIQRRHSLNDAFFIPGPWNQTRLIPGYSTTSLDIRSDDGTVKIAISATGVTITAPNLTVNASSDVTVHANGNVNVNAAGTMTVAANSALNISGAPVNITSTAGQTQIDGRPFLSHVHTGVATGGSDTGPVL